MSYVREHLEKIFAHSAFAWKLKKPLAEATEWFESYLLAAQKREQTLREENERLTQTLTTIRAALTTSQQQHQQLSVKHQALIEKSNRARLDAANRGHRFQSKYTELLDTIDAVLPGAKAALTQRSLDKATQVAKLKALEAKIKPWEAKADDALYATKTYRVLRTLRLKRDKLQQTQTY